jgi:hypothetical protein
MYKSPVRAIAAFLLRSRETQAQRAKKKSQEIENYKRINQQQARVIADAEEVLAQKRLEIAELKAENERLRRQPPVLPHDPSLPHHKFGPKMMALCVNLARRIGLRPTVACLQIVLDWLGVSLRLPKWTTVRTGMMRVGVAAIEEPIERADDWVWMADHSNQIGPEKALVIVGLRASQLPPPGVAITHQDVRVLAVQPGVSWKREDMARAYAELADTIGSPLGVVTDGAVELREGAEVLQKHRKNVVILGDFKHYAANVLKKIVGESDRFSQFTSQVGCTRSAIQQTELGHLTPPSPRPKARFMNLATTLKWAQMVLWQLDHPHSQARQEITVARVNEKLGWLRTFQTDVACWSACQAIVSASITFINEQGLFRGAANRLATRLHLLPTCDQSRAVFQQLVEFVRVSEENLSEGQRLPLSTEILESSFGLFKQLERQHSKGGFTSLLAAFGALLKPATPASIRRDFARVSVKQMRTWVKQNLKTTLASKRLSAYAEFTNAA